MDELPVTVQSNPKPAARPPADLLSAIEGDRDRRWTDGDPVRAEDYFRAHPSLAEGEAAVRLVYGEFLLRERAGESPSLDEYRDRFPALAERLAQQLELHRAVGTDVGNQTQVSADRPSVPVRTAAAPEVPGFEIAGELGRGGMAVVYKARDTRLNRAVALKVIKSGSLPDDAEIGRFRTEAEAVAQLRHPHIVQIFEVGDAGGMPYMALEFLPGGTLAHKLRENPLAPRAAAEMTELLARAVDVAHKAGVIHRDLKPGNILLAEDGSPRVADFGLAKRTDAPDGHTTTGAILGTPSYMSPEQASGQALGPPTDVYALGAILYECLTGRPPFRESSVVETLAQVCTRDPVPPSRLLLRVPSELEAVCLKCLEKSPARRYTTAGELADDLRRWLDGKPTVARPLGAVSRAWKLVRRNPVIATATAVSVLALVLGGATAAWFEIKAGRDRAASAEAKAALGIADAEANAAREREKAGAANLRAEKTERAAAEERAESGRRANYSRLLGVADGFWKSGAPALSEEALNECPSDLRGPEWHFLRRRNNPPGLAFRADLDLEILCAAVTPDGKHIVTGSGNTLKPDWPGHLGFWNASTGLLAFRPVPPTGAMAAVGGGMIEAVRGSAWHPGPIGAIALQPGGTALVTASRRGDVTNTWKVQPEAFRVLGGEVAVWDAPTRTLRRVIPGAAGPIAFSANGKRLVACAPGRVARVWDVNGDEWTELPALPEHIGKIGAVALSPDGRYLAAAGFRLKVRKDNRPQIEPEFAVYDLTTGKKKADAPVAESAVECLGFSPDGLTLVAGCADGVVRQWDVATGHQGPQLRGHENAVEALAFGGGGKWLATAGRDNLVKLWDWKGGEELRTFRGHDRPVATVTFLSTPAGERLVSGGLDSVVRVWDPTRDAATTELKGHEGMALSAAFSPDQPLLVSVSQKDETIRGWDTGTGREVFKLPAGAAEKVAFGPNGLFATAGGSNKPAEPGELVLWEVSSAKPEGGAAPRKPKFVLTGHKMFVIAVAFSPDGRRLASAAGNVHTGEPEEVRVWDTATGKLLHKFAPPVGLAGALAFSPDGKQIAVGGWGKAVAVCDAETGRESRLLTDYPGGVGALAFSPDGKQIAVGDSRGGLTFRDLADGREVLRIRAHSSVIHTLSYARDGRRIATASWNVFETGIGEVRLWDTADGRQVLELPGEMCVAFSADGRKLAAPARGAVLGGPSAFAVRVWDLSPTPLDATLRTEAGLQGALLAVASDRAGQYIAASHTNGSITIWDRTTRKPVRTLTLGDLLTAGLDFSPDGATLATGSKDGNIRLWNVATGTLTKTIPGHKDWVARVKFDPTGGKLVSGSFDRTVRGWDVASGKQIYQFEHGTNDLAVSADGRWAAVASRAGVRVFDPATGDGVSTISTTQFAASVAFGDGVLAVGQREGQLQVFDTNTWKKRTDLPGHTGVVWGVAFGPGDRLYSVGADRTVRVWSVAKSEQLAVFTEHLELVRTVVARGDWFATASADATVRIWAPSAVLP